MEREGYTYRKSYHRFEKAFQFGKYEYTVTFDGQGGLVAVGAGFFVHFDSLERQYKNILGYECPWSAGATLLNAGASPWKFWLFDERFGSMTIKQRAGYAPEVVHPQKRIEAGVRFLLEAHECYAIPFFQKLQSYRDLANFYKEYRENGYIGDCRPLAENVVYLSLLVGAFLGGDLRDIVESAKGMESIYVGEDVASSVRTVLKHIESADPNKLLA
jgi:hypothetical protein